MASFWIWAAMGFGDCALTTLLDVAHVLMPRIPAARSAITALLLIILRFIFKLLLYPMKWNGL
ncbi:hypothetical protein D3C81_1123760 [compost metagenome]